MAKNENIIKNISYKNQQTAVNRNYKIPAYAAKGEEWGEVEPNYWLAKKDALFMAIFFGLLLIITDI